MSETEATSTTTGSEPAIAEDSAWTERSLQRISEDLEMMLDRELSIESVETAREDAIPACGDVVHIAFQFGVLQEAGNQRARGAVLMPLAEAQTMAGYLMMTPESQVAAMRKADAPDFATKDSLMEISALMASALEGTMRETHAGAWSVRTLGCQGVAAGTAPALRAKENAEFVVARAKAKVASFDAFELLLILPGCAAKDD